MTEAPENEHEHDDASLERGRWLFAQEAVFISGAADYDGVPETRIPEIAFVGRSNVGKSSLINTLTGRKTLARTSNTPGRTQQINFCPQVVRQSFARDKGDLIQPLAVASVFNQDCVCAI